MLARLLVAALCALSLASGASAQVNGLQGQCPSGDVQESCVLTSMSSQSATPNTVLNVGFLYCAPLPNLYGTGPILGLTTGTLTITSSSSSQAYSVVSFGGASATATTSAPTTAGAVAPLYTLTGVTVQVAGNAGGGNAGQTFSAALTPNAAPISSSGVQLPLSVIPAGQQNLAVVSQASCSTVRGDPLFSGFLGQQFYVGGEDGQVFNMLSTHNMQLNGRFVMLEQGAAILPAEQEALRLTSVIAHHSEPSVAALPETTAWSHPGNYFGEVGVALAGGSRIHAKAGSYATGFAKLALNGRNLPVSDEYVVLGVGANTTFIQRPSASELLVRTVDVEFTVTNSDHFLNVENIHMERGVAKQRQFAGMLGRTTTSKWTWTKEQEEQAVVKSNNLFELQTIDA